MLKGLGAMGDMAKMMKAAQEMQGKMAQMQDEMHNIIVEGSVTAFATQFNSDPPVVRSRLTTAAELAPYWIDNAMLAAQRT